MHLALRPIFGLITAVLLANVAFANGSVNSSTTSIQRPKKEGRIWSGFFLLSRSTSLYDYQDGSRKDGMDYMLRTNFTLNSNYHIRLQGGYSQDLKYPENNDLSDTSLSLRRNPIPLNSTFLFSYRLSAGLPTSKDSSVRQSLIASAGVGGGLLINPDKLINGLELSLDASFGKNFHQYETALDGRVNTEYSSDQTVTINYSFRSGFYLLTYFTNRNAWSYQNVSKNAFIATQDIGYQFNPTWIFSVGHTNSGSTLKPNGKDTNIALFNDKDSLVYASTIVVF